jgi:uncharacterized membrane protein
MIIMAIDHVRDFFDRYSMSNSPTDLSQTTAFMFFTRWITHLCMPVFMFCAGAAAFLWWNRGEKTRGQLSWFLATLAVSLRVLYFLVINLLYIFNVSAHSLILLLFLYIFGACMLLMAALIHLPLRWLAVLSIAIIALHNLLDLYSASHFGKFAWAWHLLHQPGVIMLGNRPAFVVYPILPWIGVMAAGFCFAQLYTLDDTARRRISLRLGLALTAAFLVIRASSRLWRPVPLGHAEIRHLHSAVIPQLHQVPGVPGLRPDDHRPGITAACLVRPPQILEPQSAHRLRPRPALLLRPAFLRNPHPAWHHELHPLLQPHF